MQGPSDRLDAEAQRLEEDAARTHNWSRWGPYLSERQWGTVREDYSATGECWDAFTHDMARSRAYRWGEDGLLGIADRQCRLCFAIALWNGRDPILKERLFGLTGPEGNHGEDVKECYYYLDATPTHAYLQALYKYPQSEYPYARLLEENRRRGHELPEFDLPESGVFDGGRSFDVFVEYAKSGPNDILIRITAANRGPEPAALHLLPTLWFRNSWSWGRQEEGYWPKPRIARAGPDELRTEHATLEAMRLYAGPDPDGRPPELLFTENESNAKRLWNAGDAGGYAKDAFHEAVIGGRRAAVNPAGEGTKAAAHYVLEVPGGGSVTVRLRLCAASEAPAAPFDADFERIFAQRIEEANQFYAARLPQDLTAAERGVARQAYAGLIWTRQFYYYIVQQWLEGDPGQPAPPAARWSGRNSDWTHVHSRDIISMPDKWEYPWFAAWDLAFHMIPLARIDPEFAKRQLLLLLREWYMHPNGQMPAYEFAFGDVNPPVHAWACWRVYKIAAPRGGRDRLFLERAFQKLLINFTWWVNRKDVTGKHIFSGGFLGLDNIGIFDRSKPLPGGQYLEQADGTAWMAFFCSTMLAMAVELARDDPAYEDLASKFFEHFVAITDAMNTLGGQGLWDETDGFYYDQLHTDGVHIPVRLRSMVGVIPLFAAEVLEQGVIDRLPGFKKRMEWFLRNRADLARHISYMKVGQRGDRSNRLLAIPSRERLERVLRHVLDEKELLSPYGVRSLSRAYEEQPFRCEILGQEYSVQYAPGESTTGLFGGNSNWRGPVWFPLNYLLIEALERYHHFYGDRLQVEFPTGSGRRMTLAEVAHELAARLTRLFLPDESGRRPCHGSERRYADDPHWRDLVLFNEYFHGNDGRGLGASHQTGWTSLVVRCLEDVAHVRRRTRPPAAAPHPATSPSP